MGIFDGSKYTEKRSYINYTAFLILTKVKPEVFGDVTLHKYFELNKFVLEAPLLLIDVIYSEFAYLCTIKEATDLFRKRLVSSNFLTQFYNFLTIISDYIPHDYNVINSVFNNSFSTKIFKLWFKEYIFDIETIKGKSEKQILKDLVAKKKVNICLDEAPRLKNLRKFTNILKSEKAPLFNQIELSTDYFRNPKEIKKIKKSITIIVNYILSELDKLNQRNYTNNKKICIICGRKNDNHDKRCTTCSKCTKTIDILLEIEKNSSDANFDRKNSRRRIMHLINSVVDDRELNSIKKHEKLQENIENLIKNVITKYKEHAKESLHNTNITKYEENMVINSHINYLKSYYEAVFKKTLNIEEI